MEKDDAQLIHRILAGDDTAFTTLVEKYYRNVHALAWRKIGDFHHAEEITQDTFLQVYKKLSTLKNRDQFAGWLYVIVDRLCIGWLRQAKTSGAIAGGYRGGSSRKTLLYTPIYRNSTKQKLVERHYEIVKNLLEKLPEHERTVVKLHYLDEMTAKEIGEHLKCACKDGS